MEMTAKSETGPSNPQIARLFACRSALSAVCATYVVEPADERFRLSFPCSASDLGIPLAGAGESCLPKQDAILHRASLVATADPVRLTSNLKTNYDSPFLTLYFLTTQKWERFESDKIVEYGWLSLQHLPPETLLLSARHCRLL